MEIKDYLSLISQTIRNGQPKYTERMVLEALDHGITAGDILNQSFIPTMRDMGQRYKEDEVYIAKVLSAARAMKYGLRVLKPRLEAEGEDSMHKGKVILGTVVGDLHDVGKNLVGLMFESAGFEVIDLGIDVSEKKFVQAVKDHPDAVIVCISSLLTTSLGNMKNIVKALNGMEERKNFRIMVGGAPVTQEFCDEIGADAYTDNAYDAAEAAKTFVLK